MDYIKTVIDAVPKYMALVPPVGNQVDVWEKFIDGIPRSGPFGRSRIILKASNKNCRYVIVESFEFNGEEFEVGHETKPPPVVFLSGRLPDGEIETITYGEYRLLFEET